MFYTVKAKVIESAMSELHRALTDGTIESQRPDGPEIVASMQRARVGDDGVVRWSEMCFCPTPLAHERSTVYDHHFTEFETKSSDGYVEFEGEPFMTILNSASLRSEK